MQFSHRLDRVETSAIRELFKLLGQPGIISFAGGFPDSAMFDVQGIKEASEKVLNDSPASALQYGATEGYPALREELALFMKSKGVQDIDASGLIVTTGSQQALDLVGKTMLDEADTALVEAPTFLATIQCFRLYGPKVLGVPIDEHGVRVDLLEEMIQKHRPKLIYLVPTFGNPSGAMLSLDRRLKVLELAVKYETLVVEDDPYGDLYFASEPAPSMLSLAHRVPGSREWLVYCGSLSKVLSPGLRVGWMVAPQAMLQKATMCKQFSDAHTSTFAQATAAQYLKSGRMPNTLTHVREVYAERALAMGQSLREHFAESLEFNQPQGGLFFWAKLTGAKGGLADGSAFAKKAIEHGVAFVPGAPFFADHPDHSTLRLSFATSGSDLIRQGIERLAKAYFKN
ncbi:MAG: PLP-dependent aminotransferase family protein [Betaproteobacteria bacterium]|jgi:DNA-binding transcriptional MocR family regulator